MLQNSSSWSR